MWLVVLWLVIDLHALFKGSLCCFPKDPLEDVETWAESVDKVLGCKGEALILVHSWSGPAQTHTSVPHVSSRADRLPRVPEVRVQRGEHLVLAGLRGAQKDQDGPGDDLLGQQDLLRVRPDRSTQTGKRGKAPRLRWSSPFARSSPFRST